MLREDELQALEVDTVSGWGSEYYDPPTVSKLLAMIRELQARVPRWIPVSERLPEVLDLAGSTSVLVSTKSWGTLMAWYEHDNEQWCSSAAPFPGTVPAVTHWMPMPDTSQVLES